MRAYDLIVIGGGLVGGAIAWGAARQGASVALLDEGDIALRAARGNFGLVWVQSKGLGSRNLAPMVGLSMPVTPLKGQIMITERLRPFLDHATHITRQTDEGSVMMGDSLEDAGFDISSTVGVLQDIAARNMAVFPALRDANIVRVWAALRVMSPDGAPIYEQSETCPGAFSATCHSGVTLAGAHALDIAPAILRGELPEAVAPFAAGRFAQGVGHVQAF